MTTGEKIKYYRKSLGLTQTELGNILGVQSSAIAKYEKGRVVNLKRDTLAKLADVFGITVIQLLDDDDSMFRRGEVIRMFEQLNVEGQERTIEYMDMLAKNGYKIEK